MARLMTQIHRMAVQKEHRTL